MIVIIEVLFVIIIALIDANGKDRTIQVQNDQQHSHGIIPSSNKGNLPKPLET
jgi:hypothetical protein